MKRILAVLTLGLLLGSTVVNAYVFDPSKSTSMGNKATMEEKSTSAGCLPPSTSAELNVNNVRALIHSGGDMWWDLISNARYEIPKGSNTHSLFVGNLWIGGREAQTQTLKVAAQRYRSNGVDYWTGPLDTLGTASIDAETCDLYDQLWSISRQEVELFRLCQCLNPSDPSCEGYQVPESIKKWPGNPILQSNGQHLVMQNILAPFYDASGDGVYDYTDCDYPFYDLDNTVDCRTDRSALLYGDFTLWWVFNDKGNIHGESQGNAIGMEIRAQGFGFNTNDEINNMTFYNYQLINRGTTTLEQCYFGINTDADIGGAIDDYTGCDVERGFGFMYNADEFDNPYSGQNGYGSNPPAIGIDFFLGPYMDNNGIADFWDKSWNPAIGNPAATAAMNALASDTRDTTRFNATFGINGVGFDDTIPDNERFGMRRFVYYNNSGAVTGDPSNGPEYYNYLRGYWRDNSRMVFGCNGYPAGSCAASTKADFMFPGDSDPWNWGTKGVDPGFSWSETNTGGSPNPNPAGDRRFVQSAGPFTLKPGAVNDITTGVVWARASTGTSYESVLKVLAADIKAQSLFENCFKVLNGPDAPDLNIQELDQELVMYLTNKTISNNYLNQYEELNYFIPDFTLSSSPITQDTSVWVPHFDLTNVGGTDYYLYDAQQSTVADSMFYIYVGMTLVDSLYGYTTNQSTEVVTTIQIGTQIDTAFNDRMIRFEGYLIYQVKNSTVTATDIFGPDGNEYGRLVAQCDVRNFDANGNPIGRIVNFEYDDGLGYSVPVVKVDGANQGIRHSFKLTQDQFNESTTNTSKTLVNHKDYYYMALAYGYNNYKTYDPNDPTALDGQKEPFMLGRRNIKVYKATPHIPASENGGTILNSLYGFGPQITRVEGRGNGGNVLALTQETENAILTDPNHRAKRLTYENGLGPIKVKIIDPLSVKGEKYILKIIDTTNQAVKTIQSSATWVLIDPAPEPGQDSIVAVSESDLSQAYEQIIYDQRSGEFLGFSIDVHQVQNSGPSWTVNSAACQLTTNYTDPGIVEINGTEITTPGNGLLFTSIEFEDPNNVWLGFFPDIDGDSPLNWARAGSTADDNSTYWNSNYIEITVCSQAQKMYFDPQGKFITGTSFYGGGGLVPYILTSSVNNYKDDPAAAQLYPGHNVGYSSQINAAGKIIPNTASSYIGSIDIVLTDNKDLWSRCPVIETYNPIGSLPSDAYVQPGFPNSTPPKNMDLRFSFSVDKNGNYNTSATTPSTNPDDPNYISAYGMGWFPGYAIDVETGERLNIAFGEDSYLAGENGRDMLFNPSQSDPLSGNSDGYVSELGDYLFAGKHYIYVFQSNPAEGAYTWFPNYDAGLKIVKHLSDTTSNYEPISGVSLARARQVWRNCIWAGIPFHVTGKSWLNGDCRIRLRVQKNYQKDYSGVNPETSAINANNPMYEFSFEGLQTITNSNTTARSAMDIIQVVPNPYYSANEYETAPLDNRVKIVNLPDACTISIYTLNGTLIRTFVKDDNTSTSVDWDLKNFKNIPISTGLYIIHVNAPGIGEKILKWYGVMRPPQLDNF